MRNLDLLNLTDLTEVEKTNILGGDGKSAWYYLFYGLSYGAHAIADAFEPDYSITIPISA